MEMHRLTLQQVANKGSAATMNDLNEVNMAGWVIIEHTPEGEEDNFGRINDSGRAGNYRLGIYWFHPHSGNRNTGFVGGTWQFKIVNDGHVIELTRTRADRSEDQEVPPSNVNKYTIYDPDKHTPSSES